MTVESFTFQAVKVKTLTAIFSAKGVNYHMRDTA